ncbi:MAG TPA: FAD-dependent oxidoreductase [Burkholderiales bacterium]|nr:FAD-dependent oxidoreductase [Burkholderiales bacterium]
MSKPLNGTQSVPISVRARHLAQAMALWAEAVRLCERTFGPLVDLAVRLWLAQAFFVSGVLKVSNWDNALLLARNEYPVAWLDPVTAAWLGAATELGGAVLLALGLATRLAALPMLVLSLVIQMEYRALDTHLFWAALFLWYVVRGAGPIALDAALARGLAAIPLPLAASVRWAASALSERGGGWLLLALRLWLAAAFAAAAVMIEPNESVRLWLPLTSAALVSPSIAAGVAVLLAVGLITRVTSVALLFALLSARMMTSAAVPPGADLGYLVTILLLIALHGAGRWSLDALLAAALRRIFPQLDGKPAFALDGLPHVVIVGAGFGGLACARALCHAPVRVTLIDRHNYHLFQPLLYQVATAGLSAGDIATPVRGLFRDQFNAAVIYAEVTGVDVAQRQVHAGGRRIDYDYLVLATGASHSYFGRDEWAPFAPGLKRVEDATEMRSRLLAAFERAEATDDAIERRALLNFLIVGGGPTGVELAGAIAELARHGMEKEFRNFDPAQARVILVQAAARLLPTFPEALSVEAKRALEALGVEVLVGSRVEQIDTEGVTVNGSRITAKTVFWGAGVVASPAARWLSAPADNAMRVKVGDDLSVPGCANVFAIGDTAASTAWDGQLVPGLAPAAKQGGAYVARVIAARVRGTRPPPPFRYRHLGSLATIGRKAAVADFGWLRLSGAPAWWLWGLVHIGFLVGVRNRFSVMLDWCWAYLTYRSGTRLISGEARRAEAAQAPMPVVERIAA